jgi:transposase InsO family protein
VVVGRLQAEGPAKWTYFYLYVILDVFSRYAVGWTVQYRENGQLAKTLIEQATEQQQITPKILTLHADRDEPDPRQAGRVPPRGSRGWFTMHL